MNGTHPQNASHPELKRPQPDQHPDSNPASNPDPHQTMRRPQQGLPFPQAPQPASSSLAADREWLAFPGGELEGKRPRTLCVACRAALQRADRRELEPNGAAPRKTLCFQCYRAELDRERKLQAAGSLDTASFERFHDVGPLEPIAAPRLRQLKIERASARERFRAGLGTLNEKVRLAQMAARRALESGASVARHDCPFADGQSRVVGSSGVHAAELQLPESWLPFVIGGACPELDGR